MQVSLLPALPLTFLLLLLAHFLGDFVLQPGRWVIQKARLGVKAPAFWYHILLHGLLSWLLIASVYKTATFWPWALAIILLHGAIDQLKFLLERKADRPHWPHTQTKRRWFWWDQSLHLLSIVLIAAAWQTVQYNNASLDGCHVLLQELTQHLVAWWTPKHILGTTLVIFLTSPSAVIIRMLISGWAPAYNNQLETDSLKNAGTYIGIMERLFVFTFLVCGHFEAVGFLLAAKSIFRFGDLKAARDRKLTEYVLIGTLLSFGLALLAALIYSHEILV